MSKWQYVDTYIDNDVIECSNCSNIINIEDADSVITEHTCDVCETELQIKHTIAHLTELYMKKENTNSKSKTRVEEGS